MSDRPKSTPSPSESYREPIFRQTFLWRMCQPEHVETLRQFGDLLFTFACEGGMWGAKSDHRPLASREVEAAAEDLDSLVDYLEEVANSTTHSVLGPEEVAICDAASGWAGRLARIVLDMKRVVGGQ